MVDAIVPWYFELLFCGLSFVIRVQNRWSAPVCSKYIKLWCLVLTLMAVSSRSVSGRVFLVGVSAGRFGAGVLGRGLLVDHRAVEVESGFDFARGRWAFLDGIGFEFEADARIVGD